MDPIEQKRGLVEGKEEGEDTHFELTTFEMFMV